MGLRECILWEARKATLWKRYLNWGLLVELKELAVNKGPYQVGCKGFQAEVTIVTIAYDWFKVQNFKKSACERGV